MDRIGVWGPCGTGNMGNEMTMAAIVQNIRRLHPEAVLCVFSANPADTAGRYDVASKPMMRTAAGRRVAASGSLGRLSARAAGVFREVGFLRRTRQSLKDLDLLIFAGTGILTDSWGGAWRFPYSVCAWTWLARLGGTRVAVVSAGAGPVDSLASRRLIRAALRRMSYRSFRDDESKELVERFGVAGDNRVCPDLAFSLAVPDFDGRRGAGESSDVAIVGLPYRKPGSWEKPDERIYDGYVNSMAAFTSWLLGKGYTVRLVPTHLRMDLSFIGDLKARVSAFTCRTGQLAEARVESFDQIAAEFSRARIVVSSRFHGVVFSYLVGTPVLGISYHPKMNALMEGFGQEEFCVDLPTMDAADICARFERLEAGRTAASSRIRRTAQAYRGVLAEQYDTLLRL